MSTRTNSLVPAVAALCVIGGALALTPVVARAANFSISPIGVKLTAEAPIATLEIINNDSTPAIVQISVLAWGQDTGRDVLTATDAVLASPPVVRLAPNGKQVIRVGLRGALNASSEQSYRLIAKEVPPVVGGLGTALELRLPVFVEVSAAAPKLDIHASATSNRHLRVTVANLGSAHARITHLRLESTDGPGHEIIDRNELIYVLAGQRQTFDIALPRPIPDGAMTLDLQTDTRTVRVPVATGAT
ncbi:MAG: fimbrial biogenesis chaperone [Vulcanimicrobiaceae bacterium]